MTSFSRRRVLPVALVALMLAGAAGAWWTHRDTQAAEPPVYVALGASDAVGIGAKQPTAEGWVPLVRDGLGGDTRLVNLGINGATLDDVLQLELPVALDAHPTLVTIWPGVNDMRNGVTRDTFATRLDTLLAALAGLRGTQVVVLTIPDLRYIPAFQSTSADALDARVRDWNTALTATANRYGARIVDLYGAALEIAAHPEYISDDGFHPSSAGYRRIAGLTLAAIEGQHVSSSP